MYVKKNEGPRVIRLPDGRLLTLADLPAPQTIRWVISRKATVIDAIKGELISQQQACELYNISTEELEAWNDALEREGVRGLKATAQRSGFRRFE